jgi:hypothetical protein
MNIHFEPILAVHLNDLKVTLEQELFSIPSGYDEEDPPPVLRIVIVNQDFHTVCTTLEDMRLSVIKYNIPFAEICKSHPIAMANILTSFLGLSRPIVDSRLFEDVGAIFDISLLEPRCTDTHLIWNEMLYRNEVMAKEHKLSFSPLRLIE